jgi:hypothetical protein
MPENPYIREDEIIGNCVGSFSAKTGNCINDYLPWNDATEFAQAIDEMEENGSTFEIIDGIKIYYDKDTDIHWFAKG